MTFPSKAKFLPVFCLLLAALAGPAAAAIITVCPTVGNPVASGNTLITTLNSITGNNWHQRYLVRIEPGVYDIGTQKLVMKPYVDIEGSGLESTYIYGKGHDFAASGIYDGMVHGASNAELRNLTLRVYTDTTLKAIVAIYANGSSPRLSHLRLQTFGTDAVYCAGFVGRGSAPILKEVQINAVCSGSARGFYFESMTTEVQPALEEIVVNIRAEGSGASAVGVLFQEAAFPSAIRRSRIIASSAGSAWGVRGLGIFGAPLSSGRRLEVQASDIQVFSDVGSAISLDLPISYPTQTIESFTTSIAGGSVAGNVNCYATRDVDGSAFLANTCP